ncbi:hemophilus-specific protein, partial [Mannheimia haemolytica]
HRALHHEISHKALEAWQNRDKGTQSVRFMQQMPARQGLHFRFLSVSEQDGKLIVSRS